MYGQYNPYMGATPQMQQRLNYLQQQQQQMYQPTMQQPMPIALKGRIVTSMDEAKAAQIDLDGTSTFFPCPAEGKIYQTLIEKAISINHKSQEKPVTMQVAGFFFASVIFKKCPQLIENQLRM